MSIVSHTSNHSYGSNDTTPLIIATQSGNTAIMQLLIQAGADPSVEVRGKTALEFAALQGDTQSIRILKEAGADNVNLSRSGYTPLHLAVNQGHKDAVKYLLHQGADPLINASHYSQRNPSNITYNCKSALSFSALGPYGDDSIEIVRMLIQYGADVDASHGYYYGNVHSDHYMHEMCSETMEFARRNKHAELKLLLEAGADPNYMSRCAKPHHYVSALQVAIAKNHIESVGVLLDAGADPDINVQGKPTAREVAIKLGRDEILQLLDDR